MSTDTETDVVRINNIVQALRNCDGAPEKCVGCYNRYYNGKEKGNLSDCYAKLQEDAADVIGQLSKDVGDCTNTSDAHPVDEFQCSECGTILEGYTEVKIDDHDNDRSNMEYEFKFCPECGRKIKESD